MVIICELCSFFFFSSRRRHTIFDCDWSSDVCSSDLTIPVGEVTLGSDASCAISLSGADVLPRHALLQGQADGQVIIRKVSPAADVLINGVRLGAEPTPLLHGDKVEVGGHELTFVDERRSGSTQFVKAFTPATAAGPP